MMNIIRLCGDIVHLSTIIGLLIYIWKTGSCKGISGRTQLLLGLVFTTRYLDMFLYYYSAYNTTMKAVFIVATYVTIYSIYFKYRDSYDAHLDTFRFLSLQIGALVIALFVNHELSDIEVMWAFSEYLEAVAIIPQLYLTAKSGKVEKVVSVYVLGLATYRFLYMMNWSYRWYFENHLDMYSVVPGCIQVIIYFDFFYGLLASKVASKSNYARNIFIVGQDAALLTEEDSPKKNLIEKV